MHSSFTALAAVLLLGGVASDTMAIGAKARDSRSIDEKGFVRIGGIDQWVTVRGDDRDNPVVLFIHGGPGNSLSPFADSLYGAWRKNFTLVQWDQRGAGRTFSRSGPAIEATLTIDQMTRDGVELTRYLIRHLHKKRIVIVGGSWGSLLGVHIVKQAPGLFVAYIGVAQLVNMRENAQASFDHVRAHAADSGNTAALSDLSSIGAPPWHSFAAWRTFRKWRGEFETQVTTASAAPMTRAEEYSSPQDLADEEAADDLNFAHFHFVGTSMTGPLMQEDLHALGRDFSMPVYIIQGEVDLKAVPEIARAYFDWIRAPAKQFYLVPGGGHGESNESLAVLREVLETRIR